MSTTATFRPGVAAAPQAWEPAAMFDLGAPEGTPVAPEPYETLTVPGFVRPDALLAINADFPVIDQAAALDLELLTYGAAFGGMTDYLRSDEFAGLMAAKFGVDLESLPRMISVRRLAAPDDGHIHSDSKMKVVTVLLYFNTSWTQPGGQLRVLRSPTDMEDYAAEVPPVNGNLFAFRRCEHSWHGFPPCTGERRSLQLQYVKPKRAERGFLHKTSLKKRVTRALRGLGL